MIRAAQNKTSKFVVSAVNFSVQSVHALHDNIY